MTAGRRFKYELEPVRQQREWALQAAQVRIAALCSEHAACASRIARLDGQCAREAAIAAQAWHEIRDPVSKTAALAYLARLHGQAQDARREAQRLSVELERAREDCAARHGELEALEQHRDSALRAYRVEQQRRAAADTDADWCIRLHARGDAA